MRKIIVTSDKYSFCLEGLQTQMMKYWKEKDLEFTIVGFNKPKAKLLPNFKFIPAGVGINDRTIWRDALNPFFKNIKEDFFFLAFEDHYLIDDVDMGLIERCKEIMENSPNVGKIRLLPKYTPGRGGDPSGVFNTLESFDKDFYLAPRTLGVHVHSSLRPSIWRKDFFLGQLNHTSVVKNPHHYEALNNGVVFDQLVLIPKKTYPIYPDIDAMRQGKPNPVVSTAGPKSMNYYNLILKPEDLGVFNAVRNRWNNG